MGRVCRICFAVDPTSVIVLHFSNKFSFTFSCHSATAEKIKSHQVFCYNSKFRYMGISYAVDPNNSVVKNK